MLSADRDIPQLRGLTVRPFYDLTVSGPVPVNRM